MYVERTRTCRRHRTMICGTGSRRFRWTAGTSQDGGPRCSAAACLSTGLVSALSACYRAPGTARDQLIFFSEDKEISMGVKAFHEVLRQARLNENPEINEMVHRVGDRIAAVANRPEYHWEFAVIQDDRTINAVCPARRKSRGVHRHSESTRRRKQAWRP